ncbi:MAG TPA: transaldolase [Actinomycetes bacterium]
MTDALQKDPLRRLTDEGVAIWLDDMGRGRLATDNLSDLARDKHVVGVTTNPTIFQKSISESDLYDRQLRDLAVRGVDVDEALRMVTTFDVRWACDVLRPLYDASDGVDGRVSIEVDPRLAHDTERTIAEARQLWWLVDRPNLLVKIPGTKAGLPAISQCLAEGISVNVTLLFSVERYAEVMDAFIDGVERARAAGLDVSKIESVASFFVSRVDTEVDKRLDKLGSDQAKNLRGKAAIANARLAYEQYEKVFSGERWAALAEAGATPQRPLWASTGVKDPAYDDTRYVVELVTRGVVNTMPEPTLEAVADHGEIRGDTIRGAYTDAAVVFAALADVGVDMSDVVAVLEDEGVEKFEASWNELLESTRKELTRLAAEASA